MFTWVGAKFSDILNAYVFNVVSALSLALAPIALTAMTLWVLLYGWAVLRNEVSETVPSFVWKVTKIGLVLAFALQAGFYIANIADAADALAMGVATTFLPAAVDPLTVASPYTLLDKFNDSASVQVAANTTTTWLDVKRNQLDYPRIAAPVARAGVCAGGIFDACPADAQGSTPCRQQRTE